MTEEEQQAIAMFERKVVSVGMEDELLFTPVRLECGHEFEVVCYQPCSSMPCADCVNEFVKQHRANQ